MNFLNEAKSKANDMSMDSAKNFMSKQMSNLKDFATQDEKLTLNIPHKIKKAMQGGSIKEDRIEDIENNMMATMEAGAGMDDAESELSQTDKNISLAKLMAHVDQYHPRSPDAENFKMCDTLGSYNNPLFKIPCIKDSPVSEMAKELGIGPTLFLMSIKQLIKLFFVFTALNFPIYMYLSATHDDSRGGGDINTFFASFTMGALGQGEPTCSQMHLTNQTKLQLKCGHPYATIEQINTVGLASNNAQTCATAQFATRFQAKDNFINGCYTNHKINGQKSDPDEEKFLQDDEKKIKKFIEKFKTDCQGKNLCELDYKDLDIRSHCQRINNDRFAKGIAANKNGYQEGYTSFQENYPKQYTLGQAYKGTSDFRNDQEALIMITYNCRNDVVVVSGGVGNFEASAGTTKQGFVTTTVLIDILCTCILMGFYKALTKQQEDYFKRYDTETLTITKFSYMLSNMPPDEFFNFDDNIFRMRLWLQFEKILQEQGERENPLMPNDFQDCKYQLTDIQFAKNNNKEGPVMAAYLDHKKDLQAEEARLSQFEQERDEDNIIKTKKKVEKLKDKMQQDKDKYKQMKIGDRKLSTVSATDGIKKPPPSKGCECLKKKTTIYTFVTFRSMDGKDLFRKSYATFQSRALRWWVNACGCCCPKTRDHLKSLYIGGKWPIIEEAIMADNIIWKNLSVSEKERRCRIRVANFLGFLALCLSFIVLTLLNGRSVELKEEFLVPTVCPLAVSKQQALTDHLNTDSQIGLMHCYCYNNLMGPDVSLDSADIKFDDVKPSQGDQKICDDWIMNFAGQKAIYQGQAWILNFVNAIIQATFSFLVLFQKRYTLNEQTVASFQYKLILEYINMAIIPLLTAFKMAVDGLNDLGMFNGHYDDFSVEWYREIGATICYTAFLNTFQPHFNLFIEYGKSQYKRYKDRGWEKELKSETKECNTNQVLQEDLEALYTGPYVDGSTLYTNFMIQMLITFTYCGGMPVLYFIAFFNYISLYWSYKFLFLKYYQKTVDFNEGLPMYIVPYIKYAVGLHFIVTFFMLTNRDIMEPDKAFGAEEAGSGGGDTKKTSTASSSKKSGQTFVTGSSSGRLLSGLRNLADYTITKQEAQQKIDRLSSRFSGTVALYYLGFIGTVAYIYFLYKPTVRMWNKSPCGRILNPIFRCFSKIICCFINLCCKAKEDDLAIFSDDLIAEVKMLTLYDLLKRSEREYKDVRLIPVEALPWDCDPQMIQDAKISLKKRIEAIQERIEEYCKLALKEAGASHATPLMHDGFDFQKLSTSMKWSLAAENNRMIARQIKNNRMAIQRMKGVTQSYDMYDSQLYKKGRAVMKEMMM